MPKIPIAQPVQRKTLVPKQSPSKDNATVSFSFRILDRNEYFDLDHTCSNWANELFTMMKDISSRTKTEVMSMRGGTYRIHSHENAKPPVAIPAGVDLKSMYQIRIEKSKGGIHGLFVDDVFYIVWLDPLHNMYPDKHYGGLRKINPTSSCCMERDLELIELKKENERLSQDLRAAEELLDAK